MRLVLAAAWLSLVYAGNFRTDFDCTGMPDGLAWWGCRAYGLCINELHEQTDCVNETAYDQNSQQCVDEFDAAWPCNINSDCTAFNNTVHRLPELEPRQDFALCQFYFTCIYGLYAGHQMCGDGLVYYEEKQDCRPSEFVPRPCGTLDAL